MIRIKLLLSLCLYTTLFFLLQNNSWGETPTSDQTHHYAQVSTKDEFCGVGSKDLLSLVAGIEVADRHFLFDVQGNSLTEHMWWYAIIGLNESLLSPWSKEGLEEIIRSLRQEGHVAYPLRPVVEFERVTRVRNAKDFFSFLTYLCEERLLTTAWKPIDRALETAYASLNNLFTYYETSMLVALRSGELTASMSTSVAGPGITLYREENSGPIMVIRGHNGDGSDLIAGDLIYQVNDISVIDLTVKDTVELLRGPLGSYVSVKVKRVYEPDKIWVDLRRTVPVPELVTTRQLDDSTFLLRIRTFDSEKVGEETRSALSEIFMIHSEPNIIIDLRDNPGGLLTAAIEVAGEFTPGCPVVHTLNNSSELELHYAKPSVNRRSFGKIVVLINGGTASAAEIVTAVLRDKGASIVGRTTYGKGVGQIRQKLPNGGNSVVTSFWVLTPQLTSFHETGIDPDFPVDKFTLNELDGFILMAIVLPTQLSSDAFLRIGYGLSASEEVRKFSGNTCEL